MPMISEQVKTLREISADTEGCCYPQEYLQKVISEAADTIEALSAKLQAANIERPEIYYGDLTNLEKFKEWIANANIEQIAEYLLHEYDGMLYTSDGKDFDDIKKLEALRHEIEWLEANPEVGYWESW